MTNKHGKLLQQCHWQNKVINACEKKNTGHGGVQLLIITQQNVDTLFYYSGQNI